MPSGDFQKIGVLGLGLIGGSMARAACEAGYTVFGLDRDSQVMDKAGAAGILPMTEEVLPQLDMLLTALYPGATLKEMERLAPHLSQNTLVVDLCGVKMAVVPGMEELSRRYGFPYLGGHPMAGKETSGWDFSQAGLFQGASMILTPKEDFDPALYDKAARFFLSLGFGRITRSNPRSHDRIIALTSQLAHVISCAYIQSPTAEDFSGFSAGSFQDMTRVARLNETMWTELFWDNREFLTGEIRGMAGRLEHYANLLETGDKEGLFDLLRDAREKKEESDSILRGGKR